MEIFFKYKKIAAFLLVIFSGFYLTSIMTVSPIYFTFIMAVIVLFTGVFMQYTTKIHLFTIPVVLYIIYLLISQVFKGPMPNTFINVLFSLVYLIFVLNATASLCKSDIIKASKYFILFSIILLSIEALWRFSHPVFIVEGTGKDYRDTEDLVFYAYKLSSIMFQDSNFVATYSLSVFFLCLNLIREKILTSKLPLIIIGVLIFLTLSRSAIITIPLAYVLLDVILKRKSFKLRFLFIIMFLFFTVYIYIKLATDISFQTKFTILNLTFEHLSNSTFLDVITGVGYGNSVHYLGIGAHNLFITHFIESGVIGFLFFILVSVMFVRPSNKKSLYITVPFFISGFSLSGHAISYYYTCLVLVYLINKKSDLKITEQKTLNQ